MRCFPLPCTTVGPRYTSEKVFLHGIIPSTEEQNTSQLLSTCVCVYAGLHGQRQCITTFLAYKIVFPAETAQVAHRILIKLKSLNKKSPRQP